MFLFVSCTMRRSFTLFSWNHLFFCAVKSRYVWDKSLEQWRIAQNLTFFICVTRVHLLRRMTRQGFSNSYFVLILSQINVKNYVEITWESTISGVSHTRIYYTFFWVKEWNIKLLTRVFETHFFVYVFAYSHIMLNIRYNKIMMMIFYSFLHSFD